MVEGQRETVFLAAITYFDLSDMDLSLTSICEGSNNGGEPSCSQATTIDDAHG